MSLTVHAEHHERDVRRSEARMHLAGARKKRAVLSERVQVYKRVAVAGDHGLYSSVVGHKFVALDLGPQFVALVSGPMARPIPAWGNAPGTLPGTNKRAEGPTYFLHEL